MIIIIMNNNITIRVSIASCFINTLPIFVQIELTLGSFGERFYNTLSF